MNMDNFFYRYINRFFKLISYFYCLCGRMITANHPYAIFIAPLVHIRHLNEFLLSYRFLCYFIHYFELLLIDLLWCVGCFLLCPLTKHLHMLWQHERIPFDPTSIIYHIFRLPFYALCPPTKVARFLAVPASVYETARNKAFGPCLSRIRSTA